MSDSEASLSPDDADTFHHFLRAFHAAKQYFGDPKLAEKWLVTPNPTFQDQAPLCICATPEGAEQVVQLLGRLAHGIPT